MSAPLNDVILGLQLLLLLAVGNTAPLLAKRLLGPRWAWPLDGGGSFVDGHPLLGPSKTWRGVLAALLLCSLIAPVLGIVASAGALLALGAMAGDALSSFIKRRLGIPSSGKAYALDQIPEALVPLLLVQRLMPVSPLVVLAVTFLFLVLEPPLARISHRIGFRDQPY